MISHPLAPFSFASFYSFYFIIFVAFIILPVGIVYIEVVVFRIDDVIFLLNKHGVFWWIQVYEVIIRSVIIIK